MNDNINTKELKELEELTKILEKIEESFKKVISGVNGTYVFQVNLDNREIGRQVIKYHNGLVKQYGLSSYLKPRVYLNLSLDI